MVLACHGPSTDRGRRSCLVADTSGAPILIVNQLRVAVQEQGHFQLASVHVLAGRRDQARRRASNLPVRTAGNRVIRGLATLARWTTLDST